MKARLKVLLLLGLLLLAAVWFFEAARNHSAPVTTSATPPPVTPVASAVAPASPPLATATAASHSAADLTNRLAFRLTNTTNSIGELTVLPHAILLQNALLDTDAKLDLTIPKQLAAGTEPGAFIVQARGVIDAPFRAALAAAGGQIVSYIPNNAYLVRLSAAGAAVLSSNGRVQAVLPYEPYYKVNPSLLGRAVEQLPLTPGTTLELGLFTTDPVAAKAQLEPLGVKVIGWDRSPFGLVARVLPAQDADWTALARSPLVQVLEPAYQRVAANDLTRPTLGVATDSQVSSNYLDLTGAKVLVAVNDSGVDATHPDLTGRIFGPDLTDTDGHGTHVAGIIAGDGTESLTVSNAQGSIMPPVAGQFRGMAPAASLYSFNYGHSNFAMQTNAAGQGALISNNSWTYGGNFDYDLAAASYDAATRDALPYQIGSQPVLFVFAAGGSGGGNDDGSGGSADTILSPGTAKNVITVGALEELRGITNLVTVVNDDGTTNQSAYWYAGTDSGTQVASYSSRGNVGVGTEGAYGRFKPDVVAPGTFLVSTRSAQWDTNAYFNPTNIFSIPFPDYQVSTNGLLYFPGVAVPANAVKVTIAITPNQYSTVFPSNLPIYVQKSGFPTTTSYDIKTDKNGVSIPPDSGGAITDITTLQNNGFAFAVGDSTNVPVNFDLTVSIYTTNNVGDLYAVLLGMDDQLGPYYRYETGTSMAAAGVSGVLALIDDYFTNTLQVAPSPALLKAMLINGSQKVGSYGYAVTNLVNYEGWGAANLTNSLPLTATNAPGANSPLFFVDQSPTNALATGDSHTYIVTLDTNNYANFLPLKATLVWTDPCGDPAAAIKLVNNLDLIITNLDTGEVYYGNDISPSVGYNLPWNTNAPPVLDSINNVENILLSPNQELLAGSYSITVVGRAVNVNAVTAQTNSVVQDYALVVTVGSGEVPDAITSVTDSPIVTNPTGGQLITVITTTNAPLFNQMAGESSPLLGTNTLPLGTNTMWGSNGQVTLGMTNQWHFYIVTNDGPSVDYTNAAFITFQSSTLSIPRMGVYADNQADATRPEGDIDLYVSTDPSITNLNPVAISNCLSGASDSRSSLGQGGTEFVYYTNSAPGKVYYIGVKSEDREAAEYAFLPVFTSTPFSSLDNNGNQVVNGLLLPALIPDGTPAHPGVAYVFSLAILPMEVGQVTVHSLIEHQNFGDLFGALTFGTTSVVLNNHAGLGNTIGTLPLTYDDSRNPVALTRPTDGPGSLTDFRGKSALGPWILTEADNSPGQTGQVSQLTLVIQPHRKLLGGTIVTVPAQGWFIDYVDVTPGYTNLTFNATNLGNAGQPPFPLQWLQMYEKSGNEPTLTDYDQTAGLTNCLFGTYPTGLDPGNSISVGPPLDAGQYFIGIYNPSLFDATNVYVSADLGFDVNASFTYTFTTNPVTTVLDDAVSSSAIFVSATQRVASATVGMVVNTERASDLTFTLVSPTGQRVLLMENRGGTSTTDLGHLTYTTNLFPTTSSGGTATTNLLIGPVNNAGTLIVNYDMFTQPDRMDVYYDGVSIYSTTSLNPPSGLVTGSGTVAIPYGPGVSDHLVIVMNQNGNPGDTNDQWQVTSTVVNADASYLTFTDDTNLTDVPIKFGIPPFDFSNPGTNFVFSDFESSASGDYRAQTNIADPFGGWTVPSNLVTVASVLNPTNGLFELVTNVTVYSNNLVSVESGPATAQSGSNYLALGLGTITRDLPFTVGRKYQVTYTYRGPGIAGWWRGEGNASDSSDPEVNGNNGALIGRFNFPAGEVGQAFQLEDRGDQFGFAGTNTYVQIPQNPSLDVGKGGGFTVEGWINPTNLTRPQPLVEWLARVPTNAAVTNLVIEAGPVLNPATGHFYYLLGATNWTASEAWAESLGGHLVTLEDANEQNWVRDNFANYGGVSHNLWIGLTNTPPANFGWIGGQTNVTYTNWQSSQPDNSCGIANYTAVLGGTNQFAGLWFLANNDGFTCAAPAVANKIFGVVEVNDIQTNGVQFWISATNTPGTTNLAFAGTNGCLYANIVDTNFVTHEIYSAPGLLQSNVYQHVALTFDTNSGLAELYLNGTNVAVTNLFLTSGTFTSFVPKTDGDVLLGRDMTRSTNNFYYGGKLDELSIYSRALSAAEIFAIHNVSAFATNGITGKFDPSITPALGLAEAQVSLGDNTRTITGENDQWQINGFTFTATTNSLPLRITGLQPGMLLDSFSIGEVPENNLYYLPEQALGTLAGTPAYGDWTLQVWDNRVDAYVTNLSQLVSWQLNFVLQSNSTYAASLTPQSPTTFTVGPGQINYYAVPVPLWAHFATNILVSSTTPVDLLFNQTQPPTGSVLPDYQLLANATAGIGSPVLAANPPSTPPLLPGQTYYLGVRNPGTQTASGNIEVDYDIPALANGVPVTDVLTTNISDAVRYYSFDVSSNAYEATFQLLNLTGNADLVVRKGVPLPTLTSSDYGSFNVSNLDENIYVLTNSSPVPLGPGTWYLGVIRRDAGPVGYTVLAKELDLATAPPAIIDLTNGVPVNFTAGPGAALTNFFRFSPALNPGLTNTAGVRFALYNQSGNGDLTVQTNALPLAPPFLHTSQNPGRDPELVLVFTNNSQTNLLADWYLGVPNRERVAINYTIVAAVETNAYFPAFPGAGGAGGGAAGGGGPATYGGHGTNGTVYHVTSTGDSGPGTLRDAVNGTNRTVVFDITGDINLTSPIVITNSYLTIAGQSAMCGGVTVAGQMTTVQWAQGVIIRDVRFRPGAGVAGDSLQFLNVSNVIADHVSASWSANNLVSVLNSSNVTVQWSIMADSLFVTNSPQQGVGSLLRYGSGALSFNHNLYADNFAGNPQVGDNLSVDFVNNVIYNWGLFPGLSGGVNDLIASPNGVTNQLNYTGNYLIAGPDTAMYATNYAITNIAFFGGVTNALAANWIFQTNNFMDSDTNGILNGADTQWRMFTNDYTKFSQPFPLIPVPTDEAFLAYEKVLDFAGVNMCQRDPVDADIVWKVRNQTGTLISTPPTSGLIGWWKGDGNAVDSVEGNNGVTFNVTYTNGVVGQAFDFNPTGPFCGVKVPDSPAYILTNALTIEGWVRPRAGAYTIIQRGDDRGGYDAFCLIMFGNNTLGFYFDDPANNQAAIETTLAYGQWVHVAATWDAGSGKMNLYTNGVLATTTTTPLRPIGALDPASNPGLGIGNVYGGNDFPFNGQIDEIKLYNRALSASEIQSIYDAGAFGQSVPTQLPFLDTDRDGLPDFWETTFGQNPTNASNNQLSTNVNYLGYTTLEEYLAWRAEPHALTVTNTPVGVDLYQMFGNTGHLGFSVGNSLNGSVYLTNNVDTNGVVIQSNTVAFFTPTLTTPPYSGYASFDVSVTNADTVAYFGPVTVSVVVSAVPILYAHNTNGPVLATNLPNVAVNELSLLTVTNTATDANTNLTLTYTLTTVIDTNAMNLLGWTNDFANTTNTTPVIDTNGIITWTPSEEQGPGVYTLTTVVTDSGFPPLSATNNFNVTVNETNTAPFWPTNVTSQTNYTVNALNLFIVTNTALDVDLPPNPLHYSLFGPAGAMIDTSSGVITWIPSLAQAPGIYIFTNVVTDTNQYALADQELSATNYFTVTVLAPVAPYVFTQPAQAVTGISAQLNGMATPNGLPSVAWYEWGTDRNYGSNTPPVSVGAGYDVVYVPSLINGLTPNLPYHFRLVVSNAFAVVYGFDQILDEANVVAWGANYQGQINVPPSLTNAVAIAGAYDHSLALKNNGTVAAWGDNTFGQATVPPGLNNVLAVAGGAYYSMALKNGGTVQAWGSPILGQISVPPGLNGVIGIAGGTYSSLALRNNGAIVAWGANFFNLTNVPAGLSNAVAIGGGSYHNLAIRNDGTVTAWGDDSAHQIDLPAGLSNVVAIAGGSYHSLALRYDGTVVAWGDNSAGQTNVPPGLTNVVAVAAGGFHSLALKNDGSIVTWGDDTAGQTEVPPNLVNSVAIASGYFHSLALTPQSLASLTNAIVLNLTNNVPQTGNIFGRSIIYYRVNVPAYADFATNSLLYANNGSLDVWFSTNTPPTIAGTNDSLLFAGATNGVTILSTLSAPTNIVPSTIYYLGIHNTNTFSVNYGIEVDFHVTATNTPPQTNTVPVSDIVYTNGGFLLTWYAPSNELFQVQWSDNLPFTWQTFTNIVGYDTNYPASSTNATFTFFDDGSQAPFTGSRFYQLILLGSSPATNTPPVLPAQGTQTVDPLNLLVVTNTATDAESPPQTLTYTLTSTVAGTNRPVISSNGIITWTPDVTQAGTSSQFTTIVTDDGVPALSATNAFTVLVAGMSQTNTVPVSVIVYTNGGFLLTWFAPSNELFQVQWSDNLPFSWQTFTNIVGYNTNYPASMTNATFTFFDDGSQAPFTGSRFYQLILLGSSPATNTPPVLPPQGTKTVSPLNQLIVTNTAADADVPPQTLSYTLTSTVAGTNLPVISSNGIITWTPDVSQAGTSSTFTTIVTDDGVPALSATNAFTVLVAGMSQTNTVPVSVIVYTNGGFLLTWFAPSNELFQVQWSDNLPFTWQTFTNIVGYNTNYPASMTNATFTFFDGGSQAPFTGSRFYQLILLGSSPATNTPPVLPPQGTKTVSPLNQLIVTNTATDAEAPPQTLSYTLTTTVAGTNNLPAISANGIITWRPDVTQAGTSSMFTTIVKDDGVPALSATNFFTVMVTGMSQTNTVPISHVVYTNGNFLLTWFAPSNELFQVQWSDNLPFNWQTFTNIVGYNTNYPASMTNAAFTFLDDGSQATFTGSRFYQLILLGGPAPGGNTNTPPVLPAQTNQAANPLNPLIVTNAATDTDVPAQTLTYMLSSTVTGTNQPTISANGIILWTPDLVQAGTSNSFTTIVTDNGTPAMSATNAFAVIVSAVPDISSVIYTNGGFLLTWWAPTNNIFQVQFSDSLAPINWQNFSNLVTYTGPVTPTNGLFSFHDAGTEHQFTGLRFYQINLVGVGLPPVPPMTNAVPIGSIVVTNGNILLTWSAPTNNQFNVLWTTNIANPSAWIPFPGPITSTNGMFNFIDTNAPMLMKFYELLLLP